jgi:Fe-S-cluster-containing hydrogenase component 2
MCSYSKEDTFASSTSRIIVIKDDIFGVDLPVVCWHCDHCGAEETCPTNALARNEKGLVFVNRDECIGCGKCLEACVIEAIGLHPEQRTPQICNQCGGEPLCVEKCPTKALAYIETDEEEKPKSRDQLIQEALGRWGIIA